MAFNPDSYLAGSGGFDPDAYLSGKSDSTQKSLSTQVAEKLSPYYHPALEAGGAVLGGILATPADALAGPIPTAAGGALGYGAGKSAADLIDRTFGVKSQPTIPQAIKETGQNLIEGAKNEAVGLGVGKALGVAGDAIGTALESKTAGRIGQFFSGKSPSLYKRLAQDPGAILPETLGGPTSKAVAGENLGNVVDSMNMAKRLDPVPDYSGTVKRAFDKVAADIPLNLPEGEQIKAIGENVSKLTPQETYDAYNANKKLISAQVDGKDEELKRARVIFQNALRDRLSSLNGEYGPASKAFARSALRSDMTDIFPTTKYGSPSLGRAGFTRMLLGKAALPVSSPLVHGIVTAAGSAGSDLVAQLASHPELAPVFGEAVKSYMANGGPDSMPGNSAPVQSKLQDIIQSVKNSAPAVISPGTTTAQAETPKWTPDQKAYRTGLEQLLRNNDQGAISAWQKALRLNKNNLAARRGLERLAMKRGLGIDYYKPK